MTNAQFTITRNTLTGIQEVLTDKGFKSRDWLNFNTAETLYFTKEEGEKKVIELKNNCRIKSIAKSTQLNYS